MLGPSGSGKSTLLMVMTGLERPDSGSVMVAGEDLQKLGEDRWRASAAGNIGIVFQAFHLIPTMTALENVAVPLELAGEADALARAERELASVGLAGRLGHYPAELSGGEQQRVALARALAPNPAIVVADEPTGNLDETTGSEIIELLFRGHRERGTTLILVTHDTALAARCDRVLHMHSGRIAPSLPSPAIGETRPGKHRVMTHNARIPLASETRLHRFHGGARSGLLALLRADQFSLFLRRRADLHIDRGLVGKCASDLDVRCRHSGAAGGLGDRFSRQRDGLSLTGMTDYMFDANRSLFLRLLSLFHGWLPFLLVYLIWRIGYDRRALPSWTGVSWVLLPVCFFLMPPPTAHPGLTPVNINYVCGMSDNARAKMRAGLMWFVGLFVGLPLIVYVPTHLFLARVMPEAPTEAPTSAGARR